MFSKLNYKGYESEIKRHNRAFEKLARAKQEWFEQETAHKNHIAQLREQLNEANQDINITNKSLIQLKKYEDIINPEPKLSDYYQPSEKMKHYQNLAIGALGLVSGVSLVKILGVLA